MKKTGKVRKSFRNFILSRIAKSHKENEYLDVNITTGNCNEPVEEQIWAHKFVLGALCPALFEALENNSDDEILIIVPDFNASTLRDFILLTYGLLSPENVDQFAKTAILELCQTLGMCSKDVETTTMSKLEEENNVLERKTLSKLEEEVTTEDVERLLNAVEQHQVQQQELEKANSELQSIPIVAVQTAQPPPAPPPLVPPAMEPKVATNFFDHVDPVGQLQVLSCAECKQRFSDEKDFAFHQQAHHHRSLTFFCGVCRKPFEKETSLRHHKIAAHHAGTKVKLNCDKCGGKFTGKSALSRHVAHCDGKTTLDCHICGKVYARKDNLLNHLARHSGVQMKCEHCNKGFRTANDLYKHKKRLHAQVSGLKSAYIVNCEQCGRKFTDKGRAYKDHLDFHAGIKNYECNICDKKFATASSLRDHSSQHSGMATHACKICRKEFKRVQNIRQHLMWTHKISNEEDLRNNVERLFLSGVDKLRALKEIEDAAKTMEESEGAKNLT